MLRPGFRNVKAQDRKEHNVTKRVIILLTQSHLGTILEKDIVPFFLKLIHLQLFKQVAKIGLPIN